MDQAAYDSLTKMERACLRLASPGRKTAVIASELKIAPSTVETHIASGRRRLGGISRFEAGEQLRAYEAGPPQSLTSQPLMVPNEPFPPPIKMPRLSTDSRTGTVREERTPFVLDGDLNLVPVNKGDRHGSLQTLRLILVCAALIALVLIAAPAIYDATAQRIANAIEAPHTH